jgi:hypothetical protein
MMSHGERRALRRLENATGMKAIVDRLAARLKTASVIMAFYPGNYCA